ncbi:MAG: replicative DNA helicase [Carbonactinosporaceae bacterium]
MHERTPPQDVTAEQCVLGGMMLSKDAIADVVEVLRGHDFYRPAHETVYDAVIDLYGRGEPADAVTVAAELTRRGELARVGGAAYLHTLIASVPTAANAGYYAKIVKERAILRRLVEAGTKIVQLGYSADGGEVDDVVDAAQAEVYAVTDRRTSEDYLPLSAIMEGALDEIEAIGSRGGEMVGVPTGFADLDALTNGLHPGQLIILAARPALGKSTLGLDLARAASVRNGLTSVIFSLEMSRNEITMRLLSAEARVALHHMRSGTMTDEDWNRLARRMSEVADAPLFIDDSPHMSMMEIRAKCRRLRQRHDLRLVVVDYMQLMQSARRVESRQQEVSELSRNLKLLAKELEVPVIAISQLNRSPEQRTDKKPMLSDLRESGCMPASTRLLRADGTEVTLGELVLSQETPDVLALDDRWRLVPSRLTKTFPSGIKPVFRLRLASGRTVDATGNHPFRTLDGWTPLDDLAPGAFVAVPRRLPPPQNPESTDWSDERIILLAHLLGDGSIGPNSVKYATADPANKTAVEDAASAAFGITTEGKQLGRTWQLWLPSPYRLTHNRRHPVRDWLEPFGLWGSRSGNKFIPSSVFRLPDAKLALFLRHLWATDGSITTSGNGQGAVVRIYYATTSRRLADDVQRALLRFGVRSHISTARKRGYADGWHVRIQGAPDQATFLQHIGCHGARGATREALLAVLTAQETNPNVDLVPWSVSARVRQAMTVAGVTHRALATQLGERYCGSYLLGSETRPRRFSRPRLGRIAKIVKAPDLADLASSEVLWDEVKEIVPLGSMPTFDATVEGTHNFIANGVIAHNSIEQDSDVVILLHREDAYEKESPRAGEADLIVAKHRNGPTSTVTVAFQGHYSRFVDMAH